MKYFLLLITFALSPNVFAKNKYEIVNKKSGKVTHYYVDDSPHTHQPEWGFLPRLKWADEATPGEIADSTSSEDVVLKPCPHDDENCVPVVKKRYSLPQTYDVIVTDLTSEEQAEQTKKNQVNNLKQRLKVLSEQNDLTAAEVKEAIMKFIKFKALAKDLD